MVDAVGVLLIFAAGVLAGSFLKRYLCGLAGIKIKETYPFIEGVNGLLYVLVIWEAGWTATAVIFCICASALLAVGVADQKTFEIPIGCNVLIGILGCIHLFLDLSHWQEYLAGLFTVSSLLGAVHLISKGKKMGGGDVKLMAAAGLLLGWENIIRALFVGAAFGAFIHMLLMRFQNKDRVLAFGPYLAFGIFTVMLYGDKIFG